MRAYLEPLHALCPRQRNVRLPKFECTLELHSHLVERGALGLVNRQCPRETERDLVAFARARQINVVRVLLRAHNPGHIGPLEVYDCGVTRD